MRKLKRTMVGTLALGAALAAGSVASAQDSSTWDLTVDSTSLTDNRTIAMVSTLSGGVFGTTNEQSLPVEVTVTETLASGMDFSVQVDVTDFTGSSGAALDQSATIGREQVTMAAPTAVDVTGSLTGASTTPGSGGAFPSNSTGGSLTLFSVDEDPDTIYSNEYVASTTLTPDLSSLDTVIEGTYTSTITVTLGS